MASLISSEFLVNSSTGFTESNPDVGVDAQGNVVVVWSRIALDDTLDRGIFVRRFDASGDDIDNSDIEVDGSTAGGRFLDPSVAVADDGRFVVVWEDDGDDNSRIAAQLFESDGDLDGGEIDASDSSTSTNINPDIAINRTTAEFVVTWVELESNGDRNLLAQRFDDDGDPVGDEIEVETIDSDEVLEGETLANPAIAMDSSGNFVITWIQDENRNNDNGLDIFARLYAANGDPITSAFVVNTEQENTQFSPDVSMDANGNFTVVWQSAAIDGNDTNPGIFARRFNNTATPEADAFVVSAPDIDDRLEADPVIAMDAAGNALITWTSFEIDSDTSFDIFARQYNSLGASVGAAFAVSDDEPGDIQFNSAVAIAPEGNAIVVWEGDPTDESAVFADEDVFGQLVSLDSSTPTTPSDGDGDGSDGGSVDAGTGLILGTAGDDSFRGTSSSDRFRGLGGADRISGRGGADTLRGNGGRDRISGGGGNDRLFGNAGRDRLSGNGGDDFLVGGAGADVLRGGGGSDILYGGAGNDVLRGGRGDTNFFDGDQGHDRLIGSNGSIDTFALIPGSGVDEIRNFTLREDFLGFADIRTGFFETEFIRDRRGTVVKVRGETVAVIRGIDLSINVLFSEVFVELTSDQLAGIPV